MVVLKGHCHELDSAVNDTAEFFEHANISEKSKLYTNIHQHIKKGASWVLIWTKMGEKSRDTVPLRTALDGGGGGVYHVGSVGARVGLCHARWRSEHCNPPLSPQLYQSI